MSLPRHLEPGQLHSVTRRTAGRCLFLLPSKHVKQVVLYALGLAQEKHAVRLHSFTCHSNHYHLQATDGAKRSLLPEFTRELNGLVARALNAHYGRGENFWRTGSYDNSEVHGPVTVEEQLLYTWTQVVKDGICTRPEDWPGVTFLPEDFGRTITVRRPKAAFFGGRKPKGFEPTYPPVRDALRARRRRHQETRRRLEQARARRKAKRKKRPLGRGHVRRARPKQPALRPPRVRQSLPDEVTIRISPPPGYEHLPIEEVRAHFRKLLDQRVAQIHAERAQVGLTRFMGVQAALAQDPLTSTGDTFPTFARNPRIACLERERRIELLQGLQRWRQAYRECFLAWRSGRRGVAFPWGSYAHPRYHGARVQGAPLAA